MARQPCVYLLASKRMGTIYIGASSNLLTRLHQHRTGDIPGFTSRHAVHILVRYEFIATMPEAIAREKQLKSRQRQWTITLIASETTHWADHAVTLGARECGAIGQSVSVRINPSTR